MGQISPGQIMNGGIGVIMVESMEMLKAQKSQSLITGNGHPRRKDWDLEQKDGGQIGNLLRTHTQYEVCI